jgi:hypothetical protein
MRTHAIVAAIAALAFATPVLAPTAALAQSSPSYANPGPQDEQIHGRIAAFDGGYNLTVRDERGFNDTVQLHQGTIINPTGLTLQPGMIVSIAGYNAGGFFAANEIDTPYQFYGGVPYYNNYPWYHYGPTISLGFFFGSTGWWHGDYYVRDAYGYHGSTRVYNTYHPNAFYHGGTYNGRAYVASPEHGGYRAPLGGAHVAPGSGGYRSGVGGYHAAPGGGGHAAPASHGGGDHGGDHHH